MLTRDRKDDTHEIGTCRLCSLLARRCSSSTVWARNVNSTIVVITINQHDTGNWAFGSDVGSFARSWIPSLCWSKCGPFLWLTSYTSYFSSTCQKSMTVIFLMLLFLGKISCRDLTDYITWIRKKVFRAHWMREKFSDLEEVLYC